MFEQKVSKAMAEKEATIQALVEYISPMASLPVRIFCKCRSDKCQEHTANKVHNEGRSYHNWAVLILAPPQFKGMENLPHIQPSISNGKKVMCIKSSDFQKETPMEQILLVGHFISSKVAFNFLKDNLTKIWDLKGKLIMTIQGLNYYFLKFTNSEDKAKALELGHLHVASKIFFIREWRLFIDYEPKETYSLPLWAKFHNVPKQCWTKEGIGQLASMIGKPLYTDKATERGSRAFAYICIEVDVKDDLPDQVMIEVDSKYEIMVGVEYNWIPPKYTGCKVFGHTDKQCPH
ncbi:hypothetical protein GIB67_012279 [Kingdonia uniflora]|uniref:DUF4283 domain-containing protein n=1 Tax=Kingdonia uniflora TaxID=39325 RepID=A0A7J7LFV0_9MAGN|nr:hypothetical protein GIB67_012279 [Kingdonia uniflora]